MKTLVIGVGHPIGGNASVGLRVAHSVKDKVDKERVTVLETNENWFDIVDMFSSYDRVIVIAGGNGIGENVGQMVWLSTEDCEEGAYAVSPHHTNFGGALRLGKALGIALPRDITMLAIEIGDVYSFSENCTPEIEYTIPAAVQEVIQALEHIVPTRA